MPSKLKEVVCLRENQDWAQSRRSALIRIQLSPGLLTFVLRCKFTQRTLRTKLRCQGEPGLQA